MEKLCPLDNTPQCPDCPGKEKCLARQLKVHQADYDNSHPIGLDDEEAIELAQGPILASKLG